MKKSKAEAFLENMKQVPVGTPVTHEKVEQGKAKSPASTREGLKHIGGYLDVDTVEKVAILRARLGLDNSALITLAINELYSEYKAKRAFNDQ